MPNLASFEIPQKLKYDESKLTDTYGVFVAEPLEKGFGHTLGNALRRVLLSSLEGVAITSVQIHGVSHEFATIPDVIEDVTDIVLNLKQVKFICTGELPRRLELRVNRAGAVTAGDILVDGVTTVVNPDQHICTLDKERELVMEIEIDRGRGYRPAEENKREDHPIGIIPIDSLFCPVQRVAYHVQAYRVGQRTDYDSLELEVWTDGRITPKEAVQQGAEILQYYFNIFIHMDGQAQDDPAQLITSPEDEELLKKMLLSVNDDLQLSVRAQNCLNNANISYVGELIQRTESELMKYRNFGEKSLNELKMALADLDLHLGYELKEEVKLAFQKRLEQIMNETGV